jgi:hypothetical protein
MRRAQYKPFDPDHQVSASVCNCELRSLRAANHRVSNLPCCDPLEPRILHESPDTSKIGESTILLDCKNTDGTRS